MKHVGFTGTQHGMTDYQKRQVKQHLLLIEDGIFHHGDCIGADREAHVIAKAIGLQAYIHPPTDDRKRAFCKGDRVYAPLPYLDRNKAIVKSSSLLLVCPIGRKEELRSGTWATYRFAKKIGINTLIIWPEEKVF